MLVRLAVVLVLALPIASAALPAPIHGVEVCGEIGMVLTPESCGEIMTAQAQIVVTYTQTLVGCESNTCTYQPVFEIGMAPTAPGEWTLQAESLIRHYPNDYVLSGSRKELSCTATPDEPCEASVLNRQVIGNSVNSARWEASWEVWWTDPLGERHLQAAGADEGWLAQYYSGP